MRSRVLAKKGKERKDFKRALKSDALALAELIYDVYKEQGRDRMAANGQNNASQNIQK